jgi:hypothetical protein
MVLKQTILDYRKRYLFCFTSILINVGVLPNLNKTGSNQLDTRESENPRCDSQPTDAS